MIANMKKAFIYVDEDRIKKIITTINKPTLEYAAVVWIQSTCMKAYVEAETSSTNGR